MGTKYFCCFHAYREKLATLSDEQLGRVFRAAMLYAETGKLSELPQIETLAFNFIRYDIDRTCEEYERKCATNRANASHRNRSQATANDGDQAVAAEDNEKVKEEKNQIKTNKRGATSPPTRTQQPTLDEIKEYCRERQSTVSAEAFFDFYTANGWKQGQGKPIKDWRAAVRTWERRDRESGKRFVPTENTDEVILPF